MTEKRILEIDIIHKHKWKMCNLWVKFYKKYLLHYHKAMKNIKEDI